MNDKAQGLMTCAQDPERACAHREIAREMQGTMTEVCMRCTHANCDSKVIAHFRANEDEAIGATRFYRGEIIKRHGDDAKDQVPRM